MGSSKKIFALLGALLVLAACDNRLAPEACTVDCGESTTEPEITDAQNQLVKFSQLTLDYEVVCGIGSGDRAFCWGGVFGRSPVQVAKGLRLRSVDAGVGTFCGITVTDELHCWGDAPLGDGTEGASATPVRIGGDRRWKSTAIGAPQSCAVSLEQVTYCWGYGFWGSLGNGSLEHSFAPTAVSSAPPFTQVAKGSQSACGLTADGTAYCWGAALDGRLGLDAATVAALPTCTYGAYSGPCSSVPRRVATDVRFSSLSAGSSVCGVSLAGEIYCWGEALWGTEFRFDTPVRLADMATYRTVSVGVGHACGLTVSGEARCWGRNGNGQLGRGPGSSAGRQAPASVEGDLKFKLIEAGHFASCGVTLDEAVYCWGNPVVFGLGNPGDFCRGDACISTPRRVYPEREA